MVGATASSPDIFDREFLSLNKRIRGNFQINVTGNGLRKGLCGPSQCPMPTWRPRPTSLGRHGVAAQSSSLPRQPFRYYADDDAATTTATTTEATSTAQ
jgi:hypothetical protein